MDTGVEANLGKENISSFLADVDVPTAIIINCDIHQMIRVYQVCTDLTELVFQMDAQKMINRHTGENKDIEISSVDICLKLRAVMVTTTDNQIFLVSSQFAVRQIEIEPGIDKAVFRISQALLFEVNKQFFVSLGFSNGAFVLESIKTLLTNGVKEDMLIQMQ